MKDHYKEFVRQFEGIARKYSYGALFSDFLTMACCSFHTQNIRTRCLVPDPENEKRYLEVVRRYEPEEVREIAKLLPMVMMYTYDNEYKDLLGDFFTEYITKGWNGQFFTPDSVCEMMAMMQTEPGMQGKRILDPACGSGRTLLATAKISPDNYFYGADNDGNCARMSALNFYLNGLRGEVAWMNSLTMEWYGGWRINMAGLGIEPIEKEESVIWMKAPEKAEPPALPTHSKSSHNLETAPALQLSLF